MSDLLIEIGTEELPTQAVLGLSSAFAEHFLALLNKFQISFDSHQVFATPRRLGLLVKQIAEHIPSKTLEHRGPPVSAAVQAVQGFADKFKVGVDALSKIKNDKGEYYIYIEAQSAVATSAVILGLLEQALAALPIKKPMTWGTHTFKFVRPVHWLVVLLGDQVLAGKIFDQNISRETYGHRFLHNTAVSIANPMQYETLLETQGFVIASFEKRKNLIQKQIKDLCEKHQLKANIDEDLLDEVTSIVEWPVALLGQFSKEFLALPPEVISLTLKQNQKTFTVTNAAGELQPYFICIANIASQDPMQVITGNEKVVRARLSDAAFFFAQDKKQTLEDRLNILSMIIYQQGLGSLLDKSERIAKIAKQIAKELKLDEALIGHAALLCKADLTSAMVGEFPELQGIMGSYYAQYEKQKPELVSAIREHYQPIGASDAIPNSICGAVLSMSDKLDTLISIFSIGKKPTGDKDPFGLRRAAIGVLRIIIEKQLFLDLKDYTVISSEAKQSRLDSNEVLDFILDRLDSWLKDQGFQTELFASVRAIHCTKPYDIYLRAKALQKFITMPEAASLAMAHKRVNNLLKQNKIEQVQIDQNKLVLAEEQALVKLVNAIEQQVQNLSQNQRYSEALMHLASLKPALDAFFDHVLVMDKDEVLKNNRLAILKKLHDLFTQIADMSYLPVAQ